LQQKKIHGLKQKILEYAGTKRSFKPSIYDHRFWCNKALIITRMHIIEI
jgi:hypothetical protein